VIWSEDPQEWMPVNHACDPSGWLSGLDVVARLPLERGDEVTLDYATFYNERMPDFACTCESASCRRIVRGTDHLQPFLDRYGGHVSDYVRRRRADL
jgi:D-alanine-D-alanine ligase